VHSQSATAKYVLQELEFATHMLGKFSSGREEG